MLLNTTDTLGRRIPFLPSCYVRKPFVALFSKTEANLHLHRPERDGLTFTLDFFKDQTCKWGHSITLFTLHLLPKKVYLKLSPGTNWVS